MTTLIMVQMPDDVILGWDGQLTRGKESTGMITPKFFMNGNVIYGVSGYWRAADILEYGDLPSYSGGDQRKWIIQEWVPAVRELLAMEPMLITEKGNLDEWGMFMVVGGQAFELDSLLSPTQSHEGIYTHGSGADYARGALFAGASIMDALHIASLCDAYTGGPFTEASAVDYLGAHSQ